jgi:hypothetical protein
MKAELALCVLLLLGNAALAQTTKKAATKAKSSNADIQALKDAVAAQQQQIQALQQQLQQTNDQLQQTNQQFQQTQQQLQQAQQAATAANDKAGAVQSSAASKETVDKLSSQLTDVQTTLTNSAVSTQDEQKRVTAIEATLGRFRWTGDIRIRGESFMQGYDGCTACADRDRARIRVRFGFEGKLNEDFLGGIALATGSLGDPTTSNETDTNFFDRKTIALDRGYITYNPVEHKWFSVTGGKFAFPWTRTSVTFDPDVSPEGFDEKFNKDFSNKFLKNANVQFMQLLLNEVSGTGGVYHGHDAFAVGGQLGGRLQPLSFWTLTPSFTLLNFRYQDEMLNASFFSTHATSTSNPTVIDQTTGKPATFPVPGEGPGCSTPASSGLQASQACAFAANGMTNSTYADSSGHLHFLSGFLYADLILNNQFKTGWTRLPLNVIAEYQDNLNASEHPFDYTVKGVVSSPFAATAKNLGKQSHAYYADISLGQQKAKHDIQFGYAFEREEQDAIIASWGESDQRAPSNIVQHRVYALYRVATNTTAAFTWWHGRTLNPFLQNAALAPGLTPGKNLLPGQSEPWLNRLQFDLIYTF